MNKKLVKNTKFCPVKISHIRVADHITAQSFIGFEFGAKTYPFATHECFPYDR